MSWFHQLSSGKRRLPPKSSASCTPVDDDPPAPGDPGESDGLVGLAPHAIDTSSNAPHNDADPAWTDKNARKACMGRRLVRKSQTTCDCSNTPRGCTIPPAVRSG